MDKSVCEPYPIRVRSERGMIELSFVLEGSG